MKNQFVTGIKKQFFILTILLCSWQTLFSADTDEHSGKCSFTDHARLTAARNNTDAPLFARPTLPFSLRTTSGFFTLHYTNVGVHAVPQEDSDKNGIPDYIDSAGYYIDHALAVETLECGYPAPPFDNGGGGTQNYDIYFVELGSQGYYGGTDNETQIGGTSTLPIMTTYITVDNNFSPSDSSKNKPTYFETGISALKITLAHELHHAIQIGNYGFNVSEATMYELTSTWMERRVYPETRDYEQFFPTLFGNSARFPFGTTSINDKPQVGYHYGSLLGEFFHRRYADGLLKRMWDIIGKGINPFFALDNAAKERSSSLANEWCEFQTWLYHTANRADTIAYFKNGNRYPAVKPFTEITYSAPSIMLGGGLHPFEFRFLRVILPANSATGDTVDIALGNTNLTSAGKSDEWGVLKDSVSQYSIVCSTSDNGGIKIPGKNFYLRFQNSDALICMKYFINSGFPTFIADGVFPSPFKAGNDAYSFFPVPESEQKKAILTIFSVDMSVVFSSSEEIGLENARRTIRWNGKNQHGETVQSGVYLYSVETEQETLWGKFTIIRE